MFTGIITNQAIVKKKEKRGGQVRFCFSFLHPEKRKLALGESVAVNGVCLTVAAKSGKDFEADAVRETLKATTLEKLQPGEKVNTERALRFGDLIGGHFVSGHVDGTGVIRKIEKRGKNFSYWIQIPQQLKKFLLPKGSVAVDGISLTVQEIRGKLFKVAIVPHTFTATTFAARKKGDKVNLEVDQLRGGWQGTGLPAARSAVPSTAGMSRDRTRQQIAALKRQGF